MDPFTLIPCGAIIGATVGYYEFLGTNSGVVSLLLTIMAGMFGCLIPNIYFSNACSSLFPGITNYFHKKIPVKSKHILITKTLFIPVTCAAFFGLLHYIFGLSTWSIAVIKSFIAAYITNLILDTFTKPGVPWFRPLCSKRISLCDISNFRTQTNIAIIVTFVIVEAISYIYTGNFINLSAIKQEFSK